MTTLTLAEQRLALAAEARAVLPYEVYDYERRDPVPPKGMVMSPSIAFPSNSSKVGMVQWSLRLYQTREAAAASAAKFDEDLAELLLRLGKGCGMSYVLDRVDSQILNDVGISLPGYVVVGTAPLANC
jgi:hypothetical protein